MPKRKATTKESESIGPDSEDVMQLNGSPPAKRTRGRPKSSPRNPPESNATKPKCRQVSVPTVGETATKKPGKRGRPKGTRTSVESRTQETEGENETTKDVDARKDESAVNSNDELNALQNDNRPARSAKPATTTTRGRKKAVDRIDTDGEFEYAPTNSRRYKSLGSKDQTQSPAKNQGKAQDTVPETERSEFEVDETILPDEPAPRRSVSASPSKAGYNRLAQLVTNSPSKRKPGSSSEVEKASEPELRRRIGDLTRKNDTLESRYNRLREVGIVQANANMEKLRKHCETITEDSNNLINALQEELESQRTLGKQTRTLQKQLQERDEEIAKLKTEAEEANTQLSSAQTEVKALQTKLAAARNTATTLENAAAKGPSAAKNTLANRAQSAEVVQATQLAQLKEEFYTDLTGLIIRDVKQRDSDHLYDCIQTGVNGSEFFSLYPQHTLTATALHFKLVVPQVTSSNYDSAEFSYIPLLDENRDRDLLDLLPDYLTVDINFSRQQASKFYTRVIDTLNKRRTSHG
ncbi:chromosome segregation protein pcs1 [Aspergillus sclerotialis]|uniref:Chromosome segregation protein pcs1 n=1 Tax=Aspergillus sclerotialis TaxID=2070753 RepID=A0A3A3ADI0_9EURO|nr:chromosome segregation protein pcs1 [Aspergillus sclerotialis]